MPVTRPPVFIGVDVGGTKVLAAEIAEDGAVVGTARRPVLLPGAGVSELEDALSSAVEEVAACRPVTGVGLAAAGLVDATGEVVRFAPHLPWREDPVRRRLSERWGVPVVLDNDANCAAVAESALGVARGVDDMVLVALGTGIGGAILAGGRLVRGAGGMAGEFGHMQVVPDGLTCECGLRGCWEQYCSGNALERVARVSLGSHLDGPAVSAAAEGGDVVAQQAFASIGTWLGVGLANLVAAFDPALVVVGGGVSAVGDLLLDPAREALARSLLGAGHRDVPPIVPARFGPEAGVVGAAHLVRQAVEGHR